MALVVFNGVQYDDRRLPAHVNPKEAVPLEEWRRINRRVATRPRMAGQKKADTPSEPDDAPDKTPAARPRRKKG